MSELSVIKKYYNSAENIDLYGKAIEDIGLWNSEKVIFQKYLKKTDKILDLGCGAGRTTINLYKLGYKDIIGLDIAEKLIDYAKTYSKHHKLKIDFVTGDATKLDYEDNTFDTVIFSFNGMENIPGEQNRKNLFKQVWRVLKKGGYFIYTAHDRHDPHKLEFWKRIEDNWKKGINELGVECLGDLIVDVKGEKVFGHFWTIDEMKDLVKEMSFKIVEYDYSNKIAEETNETRKFAANTVFWVLKKVKEKI